MLFSVYLVFSYVLLSHWNLLAVLDVLNASSLIQWGVWWEIRLELLDFIETAKQQQQILKIKHFQSTCWSPGPVVCPLHVFTYTVTSAAV